MLDTFNLTENGTLEAKRVLSKMNGNYKAAMEALHGGGLSRRFDGVVRIIDDIHRAPEALDIAALDLNDICEMARKDIINLTEHLVMMRSGIQDLERIILDYEPPAEDETDKQDEQDLVAEFESDAEKVVHSDEEGPIAIVSEDTASIISAFTNKRLI